MLIFMMSGLDIMDMADAVTDAKDEQSAWGAFSGQLARQGLSRTALHDGLDLRAENPFRKPRHSFGHVWDRSYDTKLKGFCGDLRTSFDPDFQHLKPTLMFLARSSTPLIIAHREYLDRASKTAFTPLCRHLVETQGQYHALALPLVSPASGRVSILSAWGDEDRAEVGRYLRAHARVLQIAGQAFLALLTDIGEGPALSVREVQVLSLYAEGAQTGNVADALCLSDRSVREYLRRAQNKLDAPNRTAAVARAIRRGWI
jgi:DNA-binding CsgD family transcriptional regulator